MKITKITNIFLALLVEFLFVEDATKLRSKIILESQSLGSNAVEAAQEGLVPVMIEQLEKNAANFLQEEHASDSLIGQEGKTCIGNVDVPIHFLNAIKDFQALIKELMNQSLMTT